MKDENERPKYNVLLQHPFIKRSEESDVDVAVYVSEILDNMANNGATQFTMNEP